MANPGILRGWIETLPEDGRSVFSRYYVALLSAAALHGTGHQQPMAF
jgi:hypothetical protein